MESLRELYRIGYGPSSSHTMGPRAASERFIKEHPEVTKVQVELYGSLAATGKGHLTDMAIREVFVKAGKEIDILWFPDDFKSYHPNALTINAVECIGETTGTCGYNLEISHATKEALGLDTWGVEIVNGTIKLICTKVGAGKIRFKSSIGGHQEIPGLDFYKEISIVSRPSVAKNGGWL